MFPNIIVKSNRFVFWNLLEWILTPLPELKHTFFFQICISWKKCVDIYAWMVQYVFIVQWTLISKNPGKFDSSHHDLLSLMIFPLYNNSISLLNPSAVSGEA